MKLIKFEWHVTIVCILQNLEGVETIVEVCRRNRLRLFGHVERKGMMHWDEDGGYDVLG
jgi:hypothetical protein